jgi:hypothetical protein
LNAATGVRKVDEDWRVRVLVPVALFVIGLLART